MMNMDDETLSRLAVEALLEEAKIGAKRAEIMGPSGWIKPKESINKRFLYSTLRNVVLSNKYHIRRRSEKHLCTSGSILKARAQPLERWFYTMLGRGYKQTDWHSWVSRTACSKLLEATINILVKEKIVQSYLSNHPLKNVTYNINDPV